MMIGSKPDRVRQAFTYVLGAAMVVVGILHFVSPEPFVHIVPRYLPAAATLVYVSGVFEVLGGVGLFIPRTRRAAAYGLVALYIAVFPANINMAMHHLGLGASARPPPTWALWGRLPLQLALIALAVWIARAPVEAPRSQK